MRSSTIVSSVKNPQNACIWGGILLFLLTFTGWGLLFLCNNIYPFGSSSNLFSDLSTQYVSFLAFFRSSSLLEKIYSFSKGLGGQTFGLLTYYTSSLFNLLLLPFPAEQIEIGLFVIFLLRAVLSAESMYFYLSSHFKHPFFNITFSLLYTLHPFFTRYYFNILWADCFAILPLLILGTERVIEKRGTKLFLIVYLYALISNYYIAYIASLFVFFWFFAYSIACHGLRPAFLLQRAFLMARTVLLAFLLSAPVLLPAWFSLSAGKLNDTSIQSWRAIKQFSIASSPTLLFDCAFISDSAPHLTGGVICIFLLLSFLLNPTICFRIRLCGTILLGWLGASFILRPLGYLWHGLSAPQGFHNRQTFVWAFLLLVICRLAIEKINFRVAVKALIFMVPLYLYAVLFYLRAPHLSWGPAFLITLFSLSILGIALILTKKHSLCAQRLLCSYLCVFSLLQGTYYLSAQLRLDASSGVVAPDANAWKNNYTITQQALDSIPSNALFRTEDLQPWSQNQAMALQYYSTSHYSSVFETSQRALCQHFGYADTYYSTTYQHSSPLTDSLLGVRYVLTRDASLVDDSYQLLFDGEKAVYENPCALPLLFTGSTCHIPWDENGQRHINNMFETLTGISVLSADNSLIPEALQGASGTLQGTAASVLQQNGMFLSLSVETEDAYLLSTIPYDAAWHVTVNGRRVAIQRFMEYFLSIPLESGVNSIKLVYIPKGLPLGLTFFAIGLVGMLGRHLFCRRKKAGAQ